MALQFYEDIGQMPSKKKRNRRREIVKMQRESEAKAMLTHLPLAIDQMKALFEYVDNKLEQGCDHSLTYTIKFLSEKNWPQVPVLAWMEEHGGYCDCEVIGNAEEVFQSILERAKPESSHEE